MVQEFTAVETGIFNALIALINESMTLYTQAAQAMAISQVWQAVQV